MHPGLVTGCRSCTDLGTAALLARFLPNGSPDVTFGVGGLVTNQIADGSRADAAVVQSDGRIVVAGAARVGNETRFLLTRLLGGDAAPGPSRCTAKKFELAAAAGKGLAGCFAGDAGSGRHNVAFVCRPRWIDKLKSTWARTEAKARDCLTVGDSAMAEAILDDFIAPLANAVFPPTRNQCAKLKFGAVARGTSELLCLAHAIERGVEVDENCVMMANTTLAKAWADAEKASDCSRVGDVATGQAAIATFSSDLRTTLTPP